MSKKRKRIRTRRQKALRWAVISAAIILAVNYIFHLGVLFPRQAYHKLEEHDGVGWTRVVERSWVNEVGFLRRAYLSGNENATLFGHVEPSLYGWFPGFSVALDCSGDEPLYPGYSMIYGSGEGEFAWFFFGRVDDPAIETVRIDVHVEDYDSNSYAVLGELVRSHAAELKEMGGYRYFLIKDTEEWTAERNGLRASPRPVAVAYDSAGREMLRLDIEQWNSSYLG